MRLKFTDPKGQEQIIDLVALMGASGNALEIDTNGSLHTTQVSAAGAAQGFVGDAAKVSVAGGMDARGNYPATWYLSGSASGSVQTDNAEVYVSSDLRAYNTHAIENTSATDPVDVHCSIDGTNYAVAAASALLHDDTTTGGGVKVVTIPAGKIGVVSGKYYKLKVLKAGATAETPSVRFAHSVA